MINIKTIEVSSYIPLRDVLPGEAFKRESNRPRSATY
jgi:hypothetical protein